MYIHEYNLNGQFGTKKKQIICDRIFLIIFVGVNKKTPTEKYIFIDEIYSIFSWKLKVGKIT